MTLKLMKVEKIYQLNPLGADEQLDRPSGIRQQRWPETYDHTGAYNDYVKVDGYESRYMRNRYMHPLITSFDDPSRYQMPTQRQALMDEWKRKIEAEHFDHPRSPCRCDAGPLNCTVSFILP